jgi:hypothetical protein
VAKPVESLGTAGVGIAYRLFVHAAALGWLWREATALDMESGYVMLRWAVYLTTVAFISHRVGDHVTPMFLHLPWMAVAAWYWQLIGRAPGSEYAFLNATTVIALAVLVCAFASSFVAQPREAGGAYRLAVHAGVWMLLLRELWPHSINSGGDLVALSWAAYLAGVQVLSWRLRDEVTSAFAHLPFVGVALVLVARILLGDLLFGPPEVPFFNRETLMDAAIIGLTLVISLLLRPEGMGRVYRLFAHAAVLGVLWRELHGMQYGDGYVLFAWATYAVLLHLVAWRTKHVETRWVGHALFAVCGVWLLGRFLFGLLLKNPDALAVLNPKGLADLGVIVLGLLVYGLAAYPRVLATAYAWWLHFAFLGWTWQELGLIPNNDGNGYVSIAWGVYGVALVLVGLRFDRSRPLLLAGLTTLFAVAAKLFLVDLRYVGVLWRIFLFLGFGGAFLLFSYYLGGVMKPKQDALSK